jgi:hypothetical protein
MRRRRRTELADVKPRNDTQGSSRFQATNFLRPINAANLSKQTLLRHSQACFPNFQSRDRRPFVRIIRIYDSARVPRYTVELLDIGSNIKVFFFMCIMSRLRIDSLQSNT